MRLVIFLLLLGTLETVGIYTFLLHVPSFSTVSKFSGRSVMKITYRISLSICHGVIYTPRKQNMSLFFYFSFTSGD